MRKKGERDMFSIRNKRDRVRFIKQEVGRMFSKSFAAKEDQNLSRLRELLSLPGNQFFLTHSIYTKEFTKRMRNPSTNQNATYIYANPYETFENVISLVFGNKNVCLDTMSIEEIEIAESFIYGD